MKSSSSKDRLHINIFEILTNSRSVYIANNDNNNTDTTTNSIDDNNTNNDSLQEMSRIHLGQSKSYKDLFKLSSKTLLMYMFVIIPQTKYKLSSIPTRNLHLVFPPLAQAPQSGIRVVTEEPHTQTLT